MQSEGKLGGLQGGGHSKSAGELTGGRGSPGCDVRTTTMAGMRCIWVVGALGIEHAMVP